MAALESTSLRLRPAGHRFRPAGHGRQAPHAGQLPRPERLAGDVHLQPLPLCQGRHRPHRARLPRTATLGIGSVAIMSNDVAVYPEDSPEHAALGAALLSLPYLLMRHRKWPGLRRGVHARTSSATTPNSNCNIAAASMHRAQPGPPDAPRELFEAMRLLDQMEGFIGNPAFSAANRQIH
jgi:hypothetical protein